MQKLESLDFLSLGKLTHLINLSKMCGILEMKILGDIFSLGHE